MVMYVMNFNKFRRACSKAKTTDLKRLYAWNFWDYIPIADTIKRAASVPPHAQHPSPQYRVPLSERPTAPSISRETEAMLKRYTNLFTKPTELNGDPAAATIRLPADWRVSLSKYYNHSRRYERTNRLKGSRVPH